MQWAHRVAERFPDGQLIVDLRGHEPNGALTASDALAHILRSLGVPADHTPTPVAEQAALYRSLLHGKRMLLVLDNAASVDVVLPLVPASATNMLLLTSRRTMAALATHHAVRAIGVDEFSADEARALLVVLLGADRAGVDSGAADDLARLCGRLPLALRIAAAKLVGQPGRPIRDFVAELAGVHRLDALAVEGGSRSVRAVFASAYRVLNPVTARVFRLLGLHPGTTFTGWQAAAVTGLPLGVAEQALDELVAAHLVVGDGGDRFRFHDLIQLFAQQCATHEDDAGERGEAAARLIDWYVAVAETSNRAVDPGRNRVVPALRHTPAHVPAMPDAPAALAVLDRERGNLLPVVRYAAEHDHPTAAWQLTYLLSGFYDARGHWSERIEICRWGLAGARQLGDPATEGLMHSSLSLAYIATRRFTEALEHLHTARPLMRTAGDRRGEGHVYNNIALAYCGLRRFDEGAEAFRRAYDVHAACGHDLGAALAQNNLGHACVRMGKPELGMAALTAALATFRTLGNARLAAGTLHSLGEASLRLGNPDDALRHLDQAVDAFRQIGDRWYEAETLTALGRARLATGNHQAAIDHFEQALKVAQDIADQNLEAITLGHIGQVLLRTGDLTAAREQLRLALALRLRVPDAYEEAHVHRCLSDLERQAANASSAEHHRERAIRLYQKANATDEADRLAAHPGTPAG